MQSEKVEKEEVLSGSDLKNSKEKVDAQHHLFRLRIKNQNWGSERTEKMDRQGRHLDLEQQSPLVFFMKTMYKASGNVIYN